MRHGSHNIHVPRLSSCRPEPLTARAAAIRSCRDPGGHADARSCESEDSGSRKCEDAPVFKGAGRVNALVTGVFVLLLVATLSLGACSGGSSSADPTPDANSAPATAPPGSPQELCLRGVHHTPRSNINVNRAVVVPLTRVKRWVLSTTPLLHWRTFASSLARAPLSERVGVCVLTKRDGSKFDPGAGEKPVESVVTIVRLNGESTIFEIGTLESNLDDTPTTFARYG